MTSNCPTCHMPFAKDTRVTETLDRTRSRTRRLADIANSRHFALFVQHLPDYSG